MTGKSLFRLFTRPSKLNGKLNGDEIRLYLLLLSGSHESGEGTIGFGTIRGALSKGFSLDKLKECCHKLNEQGLIKVNSSFPEDERRDFVLTYRIIPVAKGKGGRDEDTRRG